MTIQLLGYSSSFSPADSIPVHSLSDSHEAEHHRS